MPQQANQPLPAGYTLNGYRIESQLSSPFELDLAWTVNLDKERFIGRLALAEEKARGPQWLFVGVEVDWNSLERLYQEVGLATREPA